jgi:acyl-CoA hydrolase
VTALSHPDLTPVDPAYAEPASREQLASAAETLRDRGIEVEIVADGQAARDLVDQLIPDGAVVYNTTSRTLDSTGIAADIVGSERFTATRSITDALDHATQGEDFRRHVSNMDIVVGSVHAITEDGHAVVASASGSQLAAYAFGATRVIWVVGAQKVVADLDEAFDRIENHSYPLEDARAREVYGFASYIGKQLVVSRERPGRITVILVEEPLGY